jgi:glucose-1-phosphate cytidylyltransferase
MKVVILCGGKGTRLREETEFRPKPMIPIGTRPILWHIMKIYSTHGFREFVLCLGYKGDVIKEYFRNYLWNSCDATLTLGREADVRFNGHHDEADWTITLADTGQDSMTAWRIKSIDKYLGDDRRFLLTYGDGVGDVAIQSVVSAHEQSGKMCTLTAVHPPGRFGELSLAGESVTGFNEKPQTEGGYINGGFMVCERSLIAELPEDPCVMLEQGPLQRLAATGRLGAYRHDGFWQPMDTFQEFTLLNRLWDSGRAPWKVW